MATRRRRPPAHQRAPAAASDAPTGLSFAHGVLATLDAASVARILTACVQRTAEPGSVILGTGEQSRFACFMLSGTACVMVDAPDGRSVPFREIGPGDVVGELAAIDGGARSATVEAVTPCSYAAIDERAFHQLIAREPALALALLRHLSAQVRSLTQRIYELSTLSVSCRIRADLVRQAIQAPLEGKLRIISPAPRHDAMASRLATHREAVSREISQLVRLGLVRRTRGALVVTDLPALAALVEGIDPRSNGDRGLRERRGHEPDDDDTGR